jgi:hypothetical protein
MEWSKSLTVEEEDEIINQIADKIIEYKMEAVAVLFFTTIRPLSYIAGQLGRAFVSPFTYVLSDLGLTAEKMLIIFEKRENVERLINLLEESK